MIVLGNGTRGKSLSGNYHLFFLLFALYPSRPLGQIDLEIGKWRIGGKGAGRNSFRFPSPHPLSTLPTSHTLRAEEDS